MSGTGCGSQIVDHVLGGDNTQAGVEEHGRMENTLIIGFPTFPVVTTKLDEFLLVFSFLDVFFQLLQVERIIQETIMLIPLVDDTTPAGPSPNGNAVLKK